MRAAPTPDAQQRQVTAIMCLFPDPHILVIDEKFMKSEYHTAPTAGSGSPFRGTQTGHAFPEKASQKQKQP